MSECMRCAGCGQIADDEDGRPWTYHTGKPQAAQMAIWRGWISPIPCPDCGGTGKAKADEQ